MAAPPISERHLHHFHRRSPIKEPCRVATTANITVATALNNGDTLDGVTLATDDRVLVKDQSTGSQNGIYVVAATPVRAYDEGTDDPAFGYLVHVLAGTVNGGTVWRNTNTSLPTIGTTALTFAQVGASGVALSAATPLVESGSGAAGSGTAASKDDHVHPAASGSGTLSTVKDEGSNLSTAVVSLDFVGAGVTATGTTAVTVTIPGGGGGSLSTVDQDISADFTTGAGSTWTDVTGMTGISVGAGTWIVFVDLETSAGAAYGPVYRITDGTNIYAQSGILHPNITSAASAHDHFTSKPFVLGGSATMKLQYFSDTAHTVKKYPSRGASSTQVATHVTFLQIA